MEKTHAMISCILALSFLLPMTSAASVTRTVSPGMVAPGGIATVTLSVDVSGAADFYAVDEMYPSGWTVVDKGSGAIEHKGHWKYVVIENAQNTQLTYTIQAPSEPGTYSFSGEYMFGDMKKAAPIAGQGNVYVGSGDMTMTLAIALIAIILVSLVLLVKFKKLDLKKLK
jgi:hypothetical protein